eukprot:scaffold223147_cov14-Tisochrysis_lutea.AAC.1
MQVNAPKGKGSLFDMGCTKAEGFETAAWEEAAETGCCGGSRSGQLGAWGEQGRPGQKKS